MTLEAAEKLDFDEEVVVSDRANLIASKRGVWYVASACHMDAGEYSFILYRNGCRLCIGIDKLDFATRKDRHKLDDS